MDTASQQIPDCPERVAAHAKIVAVKESVSSAVKDFSKYTSELTDDVLGERSLYSSTVCWRFYRESVLGNCTVGQGMSCVIRCRRLSLALFDGERTLFCSPSACDDRFGLDLTFENVKRIGLPGRAAQKEEMALCRLPRFCLCTPSG